MKSNNRPLSAPAATGRLLRRLRSMSKSELDALATAAKVGQFLDSWYSPQDLYSALMHPQAIEARIRGLSPRARLAVEFLVVCGGVCAVKEIAGEMQTGAEEVLPLLKDLNGRALVELEQDKTAVSLYPEYLPHIPLSDRSARSLRFLLSQLDGERLRDLAQAAGIPQKTGPELISALATAYGNPDSIRSAMLELPVDLGKIIEDISRAGGQAVLPRQSKSEKEVIRRLTGHAPIVFLKPCETPSHKHDVATLPAEVHQAIQLGFRQIPPDDGEILGAFLASSDTTIHRSEGLQGRAEFDAVRLALLLARGSARLTQQHSIPAADLKRLAKSFPGGLNYCRFLLALARERDWYEFSGRVSRASAAFTADLRTWRWKDLAAAAWLKSHSWSERAEPGDWDPNPSALEDVRRAVLELLMRCPADVWMSSFRFAALVLERKPLLAGETNEKVIQRMLGESLAWIGIVEAGEDMRAVPYFRLFDESVAWIDGVLKGELRPKDISTSALAAAGSPRLVVQPSGEIVALDGLSPELLLQLSAFAEPENVDRASVFMVTRQSFLQALDHGIAPRDIVALLERESRRTLPETVFEMFASSGGVGNWNVGFAGFYVEAPSPEELEALIQRPPFGWKLRRIAPAVAAVETPETAAKLVSDLKKAGRRVTADRSLAADYPPRLVWKPFDTPQHLKDLFYNPPPAEPAVRRSVPREEMYRRLMNALNEDIPIEVAYSRPGRSGVERLTLELYDLDHNSLFGYDARDRDLEIPLEQVQEVRVIGQEITNAR